MSDYEAPRRLRVTSDRGLIFVPHPQPGRGVWRLRLTCRNGLMLQVEENGDLMLDPEEFRRLGLSLLVDDEEMTEEDPS